MSNIDIKKGFHGGRTEVFQLYKKWSEKDIEEGRYGKYIDIISLYPTVQFLDYLPYGKPKVYEVDSYYKGQYFGFVKCDITPPKDLLTPLLGHKQDGKFVFGLNKMIEAVIPTPELDKAIELGYKIDKVYKVYHFNIPYNTLSVLFYNIF